MQFLHTLVRRNTFNIYLHGTLTHKVLDDKSTF